MTTQVKERIIIESERFPLINSLSLPEDESIIQIKRKGFIEKSSNCWRGYVGTWEIKDDKLYLIDFSSGMYEVLVDLPILADWITGIGMVATGDMIKGSSWDITRYESEMHLTFENGLVVKTKAIKNNVQI
tara:strand:- start:542 stop:934 length:393 start_codon:yes stop_codon:yes gene_type:complete